MNDIPDDDFTAEEKALLKREMRYRINQQRMREQSPLGATVLFGVIALGLKVFAASSPNPLVMDIVGNVFIFVTLILVIATISHHRRTKP